MVNFGSNGTAVIVPLFCRFSQPSTTLRLRVLLPHPLFAEPAPLLARVRPPARRQMPPIRTLVRQLPQQLHQQPRDAPHNSSTLNCDITKGVSLTRDSPRPDRIPAHTR